MNMKNLFDKDFFNELSREFSEMKCKNLKEIYKEFGFSDDDMKRIAKEITEKKDEIMSSVSKMIDEASSWLKESKEDFDFSKMTRQECVDFVKENNIEAPFDVDEVSGDELRGYLINNFGKKVDWKKTVSEILNKEVEEHPNDCHCEECKSKSYQAKDYSSDEEIEIKFDDEKESTEQKIENVKMEDSKFTDDLKEFLARNKKKLKDFIG